MSIETRVTTATAALLDMGRPDLAARLLPNGTRSSRHGGRAMAWNWTDNRDDTVLLFRAAAIASLAEGFDEKSMPCEACVLAATAAFKPSCARVTRREFLAHQSCTITDRQPPAASQTAQRQEVAH